MLFGPVEFNQFPGRASTFLAFGEPVDCRLKGTAAIGVASIANPSFEIGSGG